MNKEFVPYEQALELKEIGFDEPCLAFWDGYNGDSHLFFKSRIEYHWLIRLFKSTPNITSYNQDLLEYEEGDGAVLAPTFSQVFRWIRKKFGLYHYVTTHDESDFEWYIYDKNQNDWEDDTTQKTYEEAEFVCLKKLIEIVKRKSMSDIPTSEELASEFFTKYSKEDCELSPECRASTIYHERLAEAFKGYGKSLVKAALKAASENAKTIYVSSSFRNVDGGYEVDEKSILNAYPENLIQ